MNKHSEIKVSAHLGLGASDVHETKIFDRVVRWSDEGLEYEAIPLQAENLVFELFLEDTRSVGTPGVQATSIHLRVTNPLDVKRHRTFRAIAA